MACYVSDEIGFVSLFKVWDGLVYGLECPSASQEPLFFREGQTFVLSLIQGSSRVSVERQSLANVLLRDTLDMTWMSSRCV